MEPAAKGDEIVSRLRAIENALWDLAAAWALLIDAIVFGELPRSEVQGASRRAGKVRERAMSEPRRKKGMTVKQGIKLLEAMPDKEMELMIDCPYCGKGNQLEAIFECVVLAGERPDDES